jgi:hypothetical protein
MRIAPATVSDAAYVSFQPPTHSPSIALRHARQVLTAWGETDCPLTDQAKVSISTMTAPSPSSGVATRGRATPSCPRANPAPQDERIPPRSCEGYRRARRLPLPPPRAGAPPARARLPLSEGNRVPRRRCGSFAAVGPRSRLRGAPGARRRSVQPLLASNPRARSPPSATADSTASTASRTTRQRRLRCSSSRRPALVIR